MIWDQVKGRAWLNIRRTVLVVAVAAIFQVAIFRFLGVHALFVTFYPAVMIAALYGGLLPGLLASALSALFANYYWMESTGHLLIKTPDELLGLVGFLMSCTMLSCVSEAIIRANKRNNESEQRYRTLIEWAPDAVVVHRDGHFLYVNSLALWIYGTGTREQLQEKHFLDLVHHEDRDAVNQLLTELQEGKKISMQEFRLERMDDGIVTVEATGTNIEYEGAQANLFILRDITERKQAEEALRRSETEARARADELGILMDTVPAHIIISLDPDCRHMTCSKKTYQFFHVPEGGNVSISAPEEERPTYRVMKDGKELTAEQLPMQTAATGREVHDFECTVHFDDGTSRDLLGYAVPFFDNSGNVRGSVGIFLDITERKRLEKVQLQSMKDLGMQEQLLIKQGRFAAMGEMIGNIAHQWRQPLNTLGLIVQELPIYSKQGLLDQQSLEASVQKAMQTISGMSHTIDDFRDFLKPDQARVHFRVREAVQKTVSLLEPSFKVMGLQIQTIVDEEVSIEGYPNEYSQVILNILTNAKDALLERKTVRPLIEIRLFSERGKAVLTVTDNAGGIPDAIIDKIFDPYFTTKGPDKGTGIGLFMSMAIIEKNIGGRLTVRNIGDGAEFRIEV